MKKFDLDTWLKWLPLLAPLPEGYAVYLAIARELAWNPFFTFVAGVVVALTGLYGVFVRTAMSEFNATLKKDEIREIGQVQTWKADVVLGVWFVGVVMITVFLDTMPTFKTLTPVALVVIGFGSNYLYAMSNILHEHEQARDEYRVTKRKDLELARNQKEDERQEAKAARKAEKLKAQELATLRQELAQKLHSSQGGKSPLRAPKEGAKLSDEILLLAWTKHPNFTPNQMSKILWNDGKGLWEDGQGIQVTRQAISQRREQMVSRGLIIVDPNGQVVQPIPSGGWWSEVKQVGGE